MVEHYGDVVWGAAEVPFGGAVMVQLGAHAPEPTPMEATWWDMLFRGLEPSGCCLRSSEAET